MSERSRENEEEGDKRGIGLLECSKRDFLAVDDANINLPTQSHNLLAFPFSQSCINHVLDNFKASINKRTSALVQLNAKSINKIAPLLGLVEFTSFFLLFFTFSPIASSLSSLYSTFGLSSRHSCSIINHKCIT